MSPSEETVLCTTSNNQIFAVKLSVSHYVETEPTTVSDTTQPKTPSDTKKELDRIQFAPTRQEFEFLTSSSHSGQVIGLDVCVRRPWIITCSIDKTVRVWYNTELYSIIKPY